MSIMTSRDFYELLKKAGIQIPEYNRGIIIQAYMDEPVKIFYECLGTDKLAIVINEETAGRMMIIKKNDEDAKDGKRRETTG